MKVMSTSHYLDAAPLYLDNFSEVTGDIIFDDGEGQVILIGHSKIGGKVIGGQLF